MRRLTVLASALILSACALSPASRQNDDAPWLALPPQALDTTLALQQRLTFSHAHGEQSVDALLECDPDELRLVLTGLSNRRCFLERHTWRSRSRPALPADQCIGTDGRSGLLQEN